MQLEGLSIVLGDIDSRTRQIDEAVASDISAARSTADKLDDVEARVRRLAQKLDLPSPDAESLSSISTKLDTISKQSRTADWDKLVHDSRERLVERGVNVDELLIDDLLDADELRRIERRFSGGFKLSIDMDVYDVCASICAGLAAGLVDFLVVRIPKDIKYLGRFAQSGSPLTEWLRTFDVPSDNCLAQYCKTSFDKVSEVSKEISGFGPKTHRLQTIGHDPLFGLVVGTIDIIRGGLTAFSKEGKLVVLSGQGDPVYNPILAFTRQLLHLLSDGFTKMGIPAPGWSLTQALQFGKLGPKDRTVGEIARWMYLNGYDSRHFLTMSTSVAAAELILRGYFCIRRWLDEDYDAEVSHVANIAGAMSTSAHPRFQGMALTAHTIATGINVGKVAFYGGNPLSINYAQLLRFLHASFKVIQTKLRSPTDVLIGHGSAGLAALDQGWPGLNDLDMPPLIISE